LISKRAFFDKKTLPKLCQKLLKNTKMKNQKPLSEHQKGRLLVAMEALNNPAISALMY